MCEWKKNDYESLGSKFFNIIFTMLGVCTLWWSYMDIIMAVFLIFVKYKKINKIKFIEIIKKGLIYLKLS
jgi:hypothetical protein